ncbi:MAG: vWA domain-containing protein [Gaiellaceae bacterium]
MWWRSRQGPSVVSSHDTAALLRPSLRTRLVQGALALAAIGLLAAAAASASNLETREGGLLPSGSTGVVVVDLSLSIADEDYTTVRNAFSRLVAENAPIGLVVFSDVAYELLPPGAPAAELRSMLRLLVPPALGPPVNPWTQSFRAGTRVSSALELAQQMLERDGVENGSILLVSDLETAPDDVPALAKIVESIRRSDIDLRVVALAPSSDARLIFEGLLQEGAFAAPVDPDESAPAPSEARSGAPLALLVLGACIFAALALHERFGGRLALPRLQRVR